MIHTPSVHDRVLPCALGMVTDEENSGIIERRNRDIRRKVVVCTLALGLSLLALAGCGGKKGTFAGAKELNVQFVPTNDDGSMEAKAKPFAEYLSEKLGCKVNVALATDYFTIVEVMAPGKVDIEIMSPAAHMQVRDQKVAQAILTPQLGAYNHETDLPEEGKLSGTFKGGVPAKADSDLQILEDLEGKRIATLSPNSANGYIYPVAEMRDPGINPTKDCTLTVVNDIPSEITAALSGQQDACFVLEGARNVFASKFSDHDLLKDLRVPHLTEGDIPNDVIVAQIDMGPELKEKAKGVFLNMKDDEAGQEVMPLWNRKGYEEANDSVYDTVKDYMVEAAE